MMVLQIREGIFNTMTETFQSIPYGNDHVEVTAQEFAQWEERICAVPSSTDWYEWTTFDFLIDQGYFYEKPKCPRPSKEAAGAGAPQPAEPAELPVWEAPWSQSRVMAEKEKVLREKERMLKTREGKLDETQKRIAEAAEENARLEAENGELRELLGRARGALVAERRRSGSAPVSLSEMTAAEYVATIRRRLKRAAVALVICFFVFGFFFYAGAMLSPIARGLKCPPVAQR